MLPKKPLAAVLLLAGAAGGPYMFYETDAGKQAKSTAEHWLGVTTGGAGNFESVPSSSSWWPSTDPSAELGVPVDSWGEGSVSRVTDQAAGPGQLAGHQTPVSRSLRDVLRFDVSPQIVMQQYDRVSTVLADLNLDGMRVPLVTGTQVHDVAGTLTYYFDRFQRLQRITIHGATGDPNRFIAELQQLYKVEQEPSLGGGLFLIKWNGQPTSIIHIAPASVIQANNNFARFTVFLELNLPSMPYGLSAEAARFVQTGKATQRWQ